MSYHADTGTATESPAEAQSPGTAEPTASRRPPARGYAALSGVLAVGAALAVTELAGALLPGARSLVLAVGDLVIDSVPGWLERAAIAVLGTADKPVLIVGILTVCAALGALVGILASRRFGIAVLAFALAAAFGLAAALQDPQNAIGQSLLVALAGALAGVLALRSLLRAAPAPAGSAPAEPRPTGAQTDRRAFLRAALAATAVVVVGGVGSRLAAGRERIAEVRSTLRIPRPARPAPPPPPAADLEIAGLSPLYIENDEFYRIDTALTVPQVDPATWSMRMGGMVDRPFTLSYDDLLSLPHIEADITLACVSNEVGGDLVGNARWQGVRLRDLLERAGVQDGATQIIGRSVDGFTAGFPTAIALNGPEAMVAVAMNGEPLPAAHGFPARLVVPGLYGYVSATKWLSAIELTTFEDVQGYWIPRGWAREGPIKTQSRIDVPAHRSTITAGRHPIAGVAWAPTRGIERVEVRIDEGPWLEAELAESLDVDAWRQWVYRWDATPGRHVITVRATDGTGETQTAERTPVAPDGASGHHDITVEVSPA